MFYKLDQNCKQFDVFNVHLLGNPITGSLFGLTEQGNDLVSKLMHGCEINVESLSNDDMILLRALTTHGLINQEAVSDRHRCAYFHITNKCNMNCPGCYSRDFRDNCSPDYLNLEQIKRILDNLCSANVSTIILSGGEPFLRDDLLEILHYIKHEKHFKKVVCISNGTAKLEKYQNALKYLDCLSFSLDGYSYETSFFRKSSFEHVVNYIKELACDVHKINIIFTLHSKNCTYLDEMRALAKQLKVSYNFSILSTSHSRETEAFELTEQDISVITQDVLCKKIQIDDTPSQNSLGCRICCGAGSLLISICANGDIMPCHMFSDKQFIMGNALVDDLNAFFELHKNPLFPVDRKENCKDCELKYLCGGGCPFRSYASSGDPYGADPFCPLHRASIQKTLRALIG